MVRTVLIVVLVAMLAAAAFPFIAWISADAPAPAPVPEPTTIPEVAATVPVVETPPAASPTASEPPRRFDRATWWNYFDASHKLATGSRLTSTYDEFTDTRRVRFDCELAAAPLDAESPKPIFATVALNYSGKGQNVGNTRGGECGVYVRIFYAAGTRPFGGQVVDWKLANGVMPWPADGRGEPDGGSSYEREWLDDKDLAKTVVPAEFSLLSISLGVTMEELATIVQDEKARGRFGNALISIPPESRRLLADFLARTAWR